MRAKNHVGKKFGRLTVLEYLGSFSIGNRKRRVYKCICSCGKYTNLTSTVISREMTKSCGCLHAETTGLINYKHGEAKVTKEYRTWYHVISRCECPTDAKYINYGARGIKVCDRWRNSYEYFLEDMGRAPTSFHSIERIDVNGDYCPENCRWATNLEQSNNKTTNIFINYNGETMTMSQFARAYNIPYKSFHKNYRKRGKSIELILKQYGRI